MHQLFKSSTPDANQPTNQVKQSKAKRKHKYKYKRRYYAQRSTLLAPTSIAGIGRMLSSKLPYLRVSTSGHHSQNPQSLVHWIVGVQHYAILIIVGYNNNIIIVGRWIESCDTPFYFVALSNTGGVRDHQPCSSGIATDGVSCRSHLGFDRWWICRGLCRRIGVCLSRLCGILLRRIGGWRWSQQQQQQQQQQQPNRIRWHQQSNFVFLPWCLDRRRSRSAGILPEPWNCFDNMVLVQFGILDQFLCVTTTGCGEA